MHGIVTADRLAIEKRELAACPIDGERRRFTAIAVDGVEVPVVRTERQERRVLQL